MTELACVDIQLGEGLKMGSNNLLLHCLQIHGRGNVGR